MHPFSFDNTLCLPFSLSPFVLVVTLVVVFVVAGVSLKESSLGTTPRLARAQPSRQLRWEGKAGNSHTLKWCSILGRETSYRERKGKVAHTYWPSRFWRYEFSHSKPPSSTTPLLLLQLSRRPESDLLIPRETPARRIRRPPSAQLGVPSLKDRSRRQLTIREER